MKDKLQTLTQADIQTRCSETSFARGESYYNGKAITKRIQLLMRNRQEQTDGPA